MGGAPQASESRTEFVFQQRLDGGQVVASTSFCSLPSLMFRSVLRRATTAFPQQQPTLLGVSASRGLMASPAGSGSAGTDLPNPQGVFPNGEAHEVLPKVFLGSMVRFAALCASREMMYTASCSRKTEHILPLLYFPFLPVALRSRRPRLHRQPIRCLCRVYSYDAPAGDSSCDISRCGAFCQGVLAAKIAAPL